MKIIVRAAKKKIIAWILPLDEYQKPKDLDKRSIERQLEALKREIETIDAARPAMPPKDAPDSHKFASEKLTYLQRMPSIAEKEAFELAEKDYEKSVKIYNEFQNMNHADYQAKCDLRDRLDDQLFVLNHEISVSSIILDAADVSEQDVKTKCESLGISEEDATRLWEEFLQLKIIDSAIDAALAKQEGAYPDEIECVNKAKEILRKTDLTATERINQAKAHLIVHTEAKPSNWFVQLLQWIGKALGLTREYHSIVEKIRQKPSEEPDLDGKKPPTPHP